MDKPIIIAHRSSQKEFYISKNTQLHILTALFKRAFHISADIKGVRNPRGYNIISLQDIFNFNFSHPFELVLEDENSDDKSRSQTFSQKALTKRSGRKFPPHQKQLNEAKLYIDDFQFFMTEVGSKKSELYSGIIFFNNKKSATYLGKKILRQLIYQFDQLMFFYALHPLKKHTSSILLGETLNFAIFKSTKLIHERQFPQNLNAIQEIIGYLKLLIKKGEIPESGDQATPEKKQVRRNLIQLNQQRSFQAKVDNDLKIDFDLPDKVEKQRTEINTHKSAISPIVKIESPLKSQITNEINEISFENDLYQPDWFSDGEQLNRLEKSFLSSLIKSGDQLFSSFCHGLDLKNKEKQYLNVELIKVFLKDYINKKLSNFSQQQRYLIQLNQQNRQSQVFSLLLKLNKFGNIEDFITNLNKHIQNLLKSKHSYVELARQIQKRRNFSTNFNLIKLKREEDSDEQVQVQQNRPKKDQRNPRLQLISKEENLTSKYNKIANAFHKSPSLLITSTHIPQLSNDFSESEKAIIISAILNKDPFLIQNYIPSKWSKKKFTTFKPPLVKKFIKQNEKRFGRFRNFPFNEDIKKKLAKFEQFSSLMYYLYKQRTINKKQKIGFIYLYIWSDLNVLGSFELYSYDRNLEDYIETLYTIDYTYYLEDRYGVDSSEVQNFTVQTELQLVILFLLNQYLQNIEQKTTIQKYIRAGDNSFMKALVDSTTQQELIDKILVLVEEKKYILNQIEKEAESKQKKDEKKKKDMKVFIESIRPVHFKNYKTPDFNIVYQCIDLDQPTLNGIFDLYYQNGEVVDWIDSFNMYLAHLKDTHMKVLFQHFCNKYGMCFDSLKLARYDLVKGTYQLHKVIKDQAETVQTLERIISKSK